ncbi:MAG: Fe-S-containing hydro-lyase [Caldicoprobacterales bacterium]|jgi:fumarate hydratase subunit beta|nr:Fe-S-containing hydro-lyase [Clostridiales bacterium]
MNKCKFLSLPCSTKELESLNTGEMVYIKGTLITGRDAAHKRMIELIKKGQPLPVELKDQALYYVGPCPAKPGQVMGSCGPTTSSRMDVYTPMLLDLGLKIMIGKGQRDYSVIDAMIRNKAVYLAAIGGTGALLSKCVRKAKVLAFEDLGTEAIYSLTVENFPAIVAIDTKGNDLYKIGPTAFCRL